MNNLRRLINTGQFELALKEAESLIYLAAFTAARRNQSETARLLGVARGTVISKLKGLS